MTRNCVMTTTLHSKDIKVDCHYWTPLGNIAKGMKSYNNNREQDREGERGGGVQRMLDKDAPGIDKGYLLLDPQESPTKSIAQSSKVARISSQNLHTRQFN